jgi:hypothetical protein
VEERPRRSIALGFAFVVAVCLGFVVVLFAVIFQVLRSSDATRLAVQRARANEEVAQAVGTPFKVGFLVEGTIHVANSSGDADLTIPISGPRGKAAIYAVETKERGLWNATMLQVEIQGSGRRIDLMQGSRPLQ